MSGVLFVIGSILLFVLILSVLVVAHEIGHFVVAKKAGIRVDEFGLGYPPKAKKLFTWRGTDFTLNWLPFGGFVKIFGEDGSEVDQLSPAEQKQSFVTKPRHVQAAVLVAGVVMNFLVGWVLVSGLYMKGTTVIFDPTLPAKYLHATELHITEVVSGSPAAGAGIMVGDIVTKVTRSKDGTVMDANTSDTLTHFVRESESNSLTIEILRDGTPKTLTVTPIYSPSNSVYMIGVTPALVGDVKLSFFDSIIQGFRSSIALVKETASGLFGLITRKVSFDAVSGPVGMVGMVGAAANLGIDYVLIFTALISLSLAVINLIPFPALDGGRLLFVIIEAITRRRIPSTVTAVVNTVGFFTLIGLMLLVTYHDIVRLFVK